jgi:hypothetical protein
MVGMNNIKPYVSIPFAFMTSDVICRNQRGTHCFDFMTRKFFSLHGFPAPVRGAAFSNYDP